MPPSSASASPDPHLQPTFSHRCDQTSGKYISGVSDRIKVTSRTEWRLFFKSISVRLGYRSLCSTSYYSRCNWIHIHPPCPRNVVLTDMFLHREGGHRLDRIANTGPPHIRCGCAIRGDKRRACVPHPARGDRCAPRYVIEIARIVARRPVSVIL